MAVPPDADAPPPPTARQWRCRYKQSPPFACLKPDFCIIMDGTERSEAAPVLFTAGQHHRHILRNTIKVCVAALLTACDMLAVALSSLLSRTSLPSIPAKRVFSRPGLFFCSDVTLFSARGLSPYCSFRRCSVASRSACQSVSPGFRINSVCPCCCTAGYPPAAPARSGLVCNLVASAIRLAFVLQHLSLYAPAKFSPQCRQLATLRRLLPVPQTDSRLPQIRRCWLSFLILLRHASRRSGFSLKRQPGAPGTRLTIAADTFTPDCFWLFSKSLWQSRAPPSACCNLPAVTDLSICSVLPDGRYVLQRCRSRS